MMRVVQDPGFCGISWSVFRPVSVWDEPHDAPTRCDAMTQESDDDGCNLLLPCAAAAASFVVPVSVDVFFLS